MASWALPSASVFTTGRGRRALAKHRHISLALDRCFARLCSAITCALDGHEVPDVQVLLEHVVVQSLYPPPGQISSRLT